MEQQFLLIPDQGLSLKFLKEPLSKRNV